MLALPLVTHGPFLFSSLLWLRTWYDQIQDNLALSSSVFLHSLYNQVLLQWLVEKRSNTKSYWQFMAETMGGAGEIAIAPPLYTQLYARHYARLYAWCMHDSMHDFMHDSMHNWLYAWQYARLYAQQYAQLTVCTIVCTTVCTINCMHDRMHDICMTVCMMYAQQYGRLHARLYAQLYAQCMHDVCMISSHCSQNKPLLLILNQGRNKDRMTGSSWNRGYRMDNIRILPFKINKTA